MIRRGALELGNHMQAEFFNEEDDEVYDEGYAESDEDAGEDEEDGEDGDAYETAGSRRRGR